MADDDVPRPFGGSGSDFGMDALMAHWKRRRDEGFRVASSAAAMSEPTLCGVCWCGRLCWWPDVRAGQTLKRIDLIEGARELQPADVGAATVRTRRKCRWRQSRGIHCSNLERLS
jgi:hypothetical protein